MSEIATQFLKTFGIVAIIITCGIILAIIGIQHEHLTKLRDRKAELEIMLKDAEKKINDLEKKCKKEKNELQNKIDDLEMELNKYDKKRRKARGKDN